MSKPFNAFIIASAIVKHNGRILLLEEERIGERMLNAPGGRVKPGETPMETTIREVQEETGIEVRLNALVAVVQGTWSDGGLFAKFVFEADKIGGMDRAEKTATIHWLLPEQILAPSERPAPILAVDEAMLIEYLTARKEVTPFFYQYIQNQFQQNTL